MPTATAPKVTPAVAAWMDRLGTPGLGLTEALLELHHDWASGPAETHDEHLMRLKAMKELSEALRAAQVHAAIEAVDAGLETKHVASHLGSTSASVTKWVKEARTYA